MLVPLGIPWLPPQKRKVSILGSTGSIGTSTLEVIAAHPESFEVIALSAGSQVAPLIAQIEKFRPQAAAIADEKCVKALQEGIARRGLKCEVLSGEEGLCAVASNREADVVVAAIVGSAGLAPTIAAVKAGRQVALANKESLVVAGDLVALEAHKSGAVIVPVDSEHSAIFQVLRAVRPEDVSSLVLTASGGPFLCATPEELARVTPAQAMRHPRWSMGPKISVDSATLVNKALELIEAHFLFGFEERAIEVVIHPQSIVHSAIRLKDETVLAQLSVTDMKGPIAWGMRYPMPRLPGIMKPLSLPGAGSLEFQELDIERFPAVSVARQCVRGGGLLPAVFNFANEVAVASFLNGKLSFSSIVGLIERILPMWEGKRYASLNELKTVKEEVTQAALEAVNTYG